MTRACIALVCLVALVALLAAPAKTAPNKIYAGAEWRQSEDHNSQVGRHHTTKHTEEQLTIGEQNQPEEDLRPAPEGTSFDTNEEKIVDPSTKFENVKADVEAEVPQTDVVEIEQISHVIPPENEVPKQEDDKNIIRQADPTPETLANEFIQEQAPLVSLSQIKDDQDSYSAPPTETNDVYQKQPDEIKVLSPMLTLPKEEVKEQWSIIVKSQVPEEPEKTEEPEKVEFPQDQQISEEAMKDLLAQIQPSDTMEEGHLYPEGQIKVHVVYDKPEEQVTGDKFAVKDLQEDIINDVGNAIKDKVGQVSKIFLLI